MSKALVLTSIFLAVAVPAFAAGLVNINTADQATLETLKGIGPTKAKAIIEYRTSHGPFVRIEDIEQVTGIGPKTFADIKDAITTETVVVPTPPAPVLEANPPVQSMLQETSVNTASAPAKKVVAKVVAATPTVQEPVAQVAAVSETNRGGSSHAALWYSLAALAGLLGGSVAGVRYLQQRHSREETLLTADEFDIE